MIVYVNIWIKDNYDDLYNDLGDLLNFYKYNKKYDYLQPFIIINKKYDYLQPFIIINKILETLTKIINKM